MVQNEDDSYKYLKKCNRVPMITDKVNFRHFISYEFQPRRIAIRAY